MNLIRNKGKTFLQKTEVIVRETISALTRKIHLIQSSYPERIRKGKESPTLDGIKNTNLNDI
ncbi:hypothetical protein SD074_29860 [Prolixibacter sp. SD074]|jgi:hypothetical protein|nr:hypothetical protein SD074_29860 [Prolixibacter sp. SD074]